MQTLVVNLLGGPGTGKSTTRAEIFAALKWRGIECEEAPEFAKEIVWGEITNKLKDQNYIFAKQNHRLFRLRGQVNVIITDSPLLLSILYGQDMIPSFAPYVLNTISTYNNLNIFLKRTKPFNPKGRLQSFEEAKDLDSRILALLNKANLPYFEFDAKKGNGEIIADHIETHLKMLV